MALVGGLNYISALVGLLNATLSAKLYGKFGGPQGAVKVIVLIVCVLFAVFAGTLGVFSGSRMTFIRNLFWSLMKLLCVAPIKTWADFS